jgi:hypothetical protein
MTKKLYLLNTQNYIIVHVTEYKNTRQTNIIQKETQYFST